MQRPASRRGPIDDLAGVVPATLALVVLAVVLGFGWGGDDLGITLSDSASVVLATWAAASCARAAARRGPDRRAWVLLGSACGLWAAGEGLWAVWEVGLGRHVPFPSPADVAYLAAIPVALAGLLAFRRGDTPPQLARTALDACLVSASLLFVAWATVLGPILRDGAGSTFALSVSLAYPVTSVALVAMSLMVARQGHPSVRRPLHLAAAGLSLMATTDLVFTWMVSAGTFASTHPVVLGWPAAYLLIALAARAARPAPHPEPDPAPEVESTASMLAPYAPLVLALVAAAPYLLTARQLGPFLTINGTVITLLVLARQVLTMVDMRTLVGTLARREQELAQAAWRDALTGLANRGRFAAALEDLAEREGAPAIVFVDLDGFKGVNDRFGHVAGDRVLEAVARRLSACVDDTMLLARFGGDEFVVLVPAGEPPAEAVARDILDAMAVPFHLEGETVRVGASIGLAAGTDGVDPHEALRRADAAMYIAKSTRPGGPMRYPDLDREHAADPDA